MSLSDKRLGQINVCIMKEKTTAESNGVTSGARRHRLSGLRIVKSTVVPSRCFLVNCCFWTTLLLHLAVVTIVALSLLSPYPLRPSCLVEWKTKTRSCVEAHRALLHRLRDWGAAFAACGNCSHYEVLLVEPSSLHVWHRSEWHGRPFEADILMVFTPTAEGDCEILAQSRSHGWLWPFDGGANFCVLARLSSSSSFLGPLASQRTDDSVCTQFSSAACPRLAIQEEPPANYAMLLDDFSPDPPYLQLETGRNRTQSP